MLASVKYRHTILIDCTPTYNLVSSYNATRSNPHVRSSHTYHHIFAANNKAIIHQCLTGARRRQNALHAPDLRHLAHLFADLRQYRLQLCPTDLQPSSSQVSTRLSARSDVP